MLGNISYLFQYAMHMNKNPILYLNKNNHLVKYFHSASLVLSDRGAFPPSLSTLTEKKWGKDGRNLKYYSDKFLAHFLYY